MAKFTYHINRAGRNVAGNLLGNVLVILCSSALFLILGCFALISMNIDAMMYKVRKSVPLVVFLKENISTDEIKGLQSRIGFIDGIERIDFFSKEDALDDFRKQLGENRDIIEVIDSNPLPAYFEIFLRKPGLADNIAHQLENEREVEEVKYSPQLRKQLKSAGRILGVFGLYGKMALSVFTAVAVFLVFVMNQDFIDREDVKTLKLLGAKTGFIMFPSLIQGVILAVLAFLISTGMLYYLYYYGSAALKTYEFIPSEIVFLDAEEIVRLSLLEILPAVIGSYAGARRTIGN